VKRRKFIIGGTLSLAAISAGSYLSIFTGNASELSRKDLAAFYKIYKESGHLRNFDVDPIGRIKEKGIDWPIYKSSLRRLSKICQKDFLEGRIIDLQGWFISETEILIWLAAYKNA
jgi:hypothetical protein